MFTNKVGNVFRVGDNQNEATINGAIEAEDKYIETLSDKTGLTYEEIT